MDADRLYRLLRAAVQLGVFAAAGGGRGGGGGTDAQLRGVRFRNNRLSAVLREDHPNCIRDMVGSTINDFHATTVVKSKRHHKVEGS